MNLEKENTNKMKQKTKIWLAIGGLICGLVAVMLAYYGNPKNMAICIGCFLRDTAGSLGLHQAAVVQYARPEIIGIVIGACLMAFGKKEFKSTAGSSPMTRFVIGIVMMIGMLVFLGCPLRMILRMSAGDLNAYVGFVGLLIGIAVGIVALKFGFSLGEEHETKTASGLAFPLIMIVIMILALGTSLLNSSEMGPGSMHAPFAIAIIGGLIFGAVAQRARLCFGGAYRNIMMTKNFDMFIPVLVLFVVMLIYNAITGNLTFAFDTPGIIAHSEHVWNILANVLIGFAITLGGGCPLRQLVLAGQGSQDAGVTVIGMIVGAALCHNFGLASSGTALNEAGEVVKGAVTPAGKIAVIIGLVVLVIIAVCHRDKNFKKESK